MATPTIVLAGTLSGLIKVTDQDGTVSRIPLGSVCEVIDSSNSDVDRLEICHARGSLILIYASAAEVTAAIATLDGFY